MPENLAYVIYTSGSTGKPKGVMIEQRNVVSFFTAMDHCFGSLQPAVWLAITSISFDISVLELFWTLARGHQVVIQDGEGSLLDGDYSIARQIRRYGVSHLQCTPSLLRMLMSNRDSIDALRRLKTLLVGGEALPVALVEQVRQTLSATIHNMYGPTETTIWSTTHRVEETKGTIPIGRPIANTHTYILDALQRPVPAGGIGQLYIGGAGVARGYFNRSELTAEQFRQDPFRGKPGSRIYCTGDLARYRPDGVIEYLGRADSQVKIRGYRIELGEIETALDRYPGVRQAAVAVRDDEASDKRLVAYVVLDSPAPNAAELRRYLRDQLPAYMAPAVFVRLDAMPLTDNGKVNRKALPAPEGIAMSSFETAYEGPSKGIEQTVADLWREALDVERVNINANFFDLGAHSLMVAEVHAKLQETLNCEIPLVTMFRYPTVSLLAGHLSKEEDKDGVLGKSAGRAQTRTESYRRRVGRRDAV
jgi:amino acid adenylation domain-containing protein